MMSGLRELIEQWDGDAELAAEYVANRFEHRSSRPLGSRAFPYEAMCEHLGLPVPKGHTPEGIDRRCRDVSYWRKLFRKEFPRHFEHLRRIAGDVGGKARYLSDVAMATFGQRSKRSKRSREFIENTDLVSDQGEVIQLSDAVDAGVSNPVNRRHELMTRMRGSEEYATEHGFGYLFITVTTPGQYHAYYRDTGRRNRKYNGSTPIEAHRWLLERWTLCRTALSDQGVEWFGYRVVEPHHDGTPHWHLLLFATPTDVATLESVVANYMTRDNPHADRGIEILRGDPAKGGAAAYMAKYVSKNIDGYELSDDEQTAANRSVAWARLWGIRQFEALGGPSVTKWRELRKVRDRDAVPVDLQWAWNAANAGNWSEFIRAMGGPFEGRDEAIRLVRGTKSGVNGVRSPTTTRYGEPLKTDRYDIRSIVGLACNGSYLQTYRNIWIRLSPTMIEWYDGDPEGIAAWTCGNSCRSDDGHGAQLNVGPRATLSRATAKH